MGYMNYMACSCSIDDEGNIRVVLDGYLQEDEGQAVLDMLLPLLGPKPRDLIFEVEGLRGYRRQVRQMWQAALAPHKGQARRFVVAGGNSVVRMSLSMMAMSLGVPLVSRGAEIARDPDAPVARRRSPSADRVTTRPLSRPVLGASRAGREQAKAPRRERSWAGVMLRRLREESRPNV